MEYISITFNKALRLAFDKDDWREWQKGAEGDEGDKDVPGVGMVEILMGYKGALYHIDGTLNLQKLSSPYWSIGSGADIALGALYGLHHASVAGIMNISPEVITQIAMEGATAHISGIMPPYHYLQMPRLGNAK